MKALYLILFVLILSTDIRSQNTTLENTQISVLTCRSGDELYSTFGHTAIRIRNYEQKIDEVYNYGLFSFYEPNFYLKFLKGSLPYFLGSTSYGQFLTEYKFDKRTVFEQVLNLNSGQKRHVIEFLQNNIKPENRKYAYDFLDDNCSTRVVDVWSNLDGTVDYKNEIQVKTFRDLLKENLHNLRWSDFGIDLAIGQGGDRITSRRNQMFLPSYVMENLTNATLTSKDTLIQLAKPAQMVINFEEEAERRQSGSTNWPLFTVLGFLLITVFLNVKKQKFTPWFNNFLLIFGGLMGVFLLFMWFGTSHQITKENWNIMWFNPLYLVLPFVKNKKPILISLLAFLFLAMVNCIVQVLPQFFNLLFLPIILTYGVIILSKYWNTYKPQESKTT